LACRPYSSSLATLLPSLRPAIRLHGKLSVANYCFEATNCHCLPPHNCISLTRTNPSGSILAEKKCFHHPTFYRWPFIVGLLSRVTPSSTGRRVSVCGGHSSSNQCCRLVDLSAADRPVLYRVRQENWANTFEGSHLLQTLKQLNKFPRFLAYFNAILF